MEALDCRYCQLQGELGPGGACGGPVRQTADPPMDFAAKGEIR